jgi:bifunctional UDP-N-acetylglucosamine pyrophosphorylase / glucosamine-1-phosphate N-acetyltransferase
MAAVAVVLAAGKSTRMRSRLPKPAHLVGGRPMLAYVLSAAATALQAPDESPSDAEPPRGAAEDHKARLVVVLGHESARVLQALATVPDLPPYRVALQPAQRGTGDAVRAAMPLLTAATSPSPSSVLVLYGDTPLVRADTLSTLLALHQRTGAAVTFLTGEASQPSGYGRVLRGPDGEVLGIVEEGHATDEQRRVTEVNSGIYCFAAEWLWSRLDRLRPHDSGEYYLTDLVDLAVHEGRTVATVAAPMSETAGVNDRLQLAEAEAYLRRRTLEDLMRSGVTVIDPATTYVDSTVRVGTDTVLHPFTTLQGATRIGADCAIGPHSVVRDSIIGDNCLVVGSWLEEATMDPGSRVGPMSHLRPGAHLATGAHVGNFAEVKNATIGAHVQMHHFSYAGDASIGAFTNVGAGTITCNFDGERKHHTEVGEDVFLGSDTLLIAPVTLGDGARTGAGAVVRHDVPPGGVAVGVPARVIRHEERPRTRRLPPVDPAQVPPVATPAGLPESLSVDAAPAAADVEPTSNTEQNLESTIPSQHGIAQAQSKTAEHQEGKELRLDG